MTLPVFTNVGKSLSMTECHYDVHNFEFLTLKWTGPESFDAFLCVNVLLRIHWENSKVGSIPFHTSPCEVGPRSSYTYCNYINGDVWTNSFCIPLLLIINNCPHLKHDNEQKKSLVTKINEPRLLVLIFRRQLAFLSK